MSEPSTDYRRALDAAIEEYETLAAERVRIEDRLARLIQTIGSLSRLCGLAPAVPIGLTDACRLVLRSAGHPLTTIEVREGLDALGLDLTKYSNALASIHIVLNRLVRAGEAQFIPRTHDKPAYQWKPPLPQGLAVPRPDLVRSPGGGWMPWGWTTPEPTGRKKGRRRGRKPNREE